MLEQISDLRDPAPRKRTGRPPTKVGEKRYRTLFGRLEPHLDDWQHAGSLAKRFDLDQGTVATVLRMAAERGRLETARTNPTSYRLKGSAARYEQPGFDDKEVESIVNGDAALDSLRWLKIHLSVPGTVDELHNGTRSKAEHVVAHLRVGLATGYVDFEEPDEDGQTGRRYFLAAPIPDNLSRGQLQIDMLRMRLSKHLTGVRTAGELVVSMGLTRERVRQLLDRAVSKGIVERIADRPYRFRLLPEDVKDETIALPGVNPVFCTGVDSLPITTRGINVLSQNGIESVGALVSLSRAEIAGLPGMGKKTVDDIIIALADLGLEPGMASA